MPSAVSFNDALELARRLFAAGSSEEDARAAAVELRCCGKLGLSVLRNYIGQASYMSDERAQTVATMLEGMSNDGLDMVPLLPVFLPLLTSPDQTLRDTVTDIVCRLAEDSAIAENVALGCLRNPDPDIRCCGAKILSAIAPWCGGALRSKLTDMLPLVYGESATQGFLKTAILRCRAPAVSLSQLREQTANQPAGEDQPEANPAPDHVVDADKGDAARQSLWMPDLKGRSIFFADDDAQIRSLVSKLLLNAGASLQTACDGEQAIWMLQRMAQDNTPPDLAILDLRMPGENGMRVLEFLRRTFDPTRTRAILLTAVKDQQIIRTAMQKYNIDAYLIKPVPLGDFYMRIAQALGLKVE